MACGGRGVANQRAAAPGAWALRLRPVHFLAKQRASTVQEEGGCRGRYMQINRPTVHAAGRRPFSRRRCAHRCGAPMGGGPQHGRARSRQNECAGTGPAQRQPAAHGSGSAGPQGWPHHGRSQWGRLGSNWELCNNNNAAGNWRGPCKTGWWVRQTGGISWTGRWARWLRGAGAKLGGQQAGAPAAGLGSRPLGLLAAGAVRAACPRCWRPRRCSARRQTPAARCAGGAGCR